MKRSSSQIRPRGFTLVELLVVVGIIALLIAILLPALSHAREQANLVKCLATLRNMQQAAVLHANEHQGFMPAAGEYHQLALGVDSTPVGAGDPQRKRYEYSYDSGVPRLAPLVVPLAMYMGVKPASDDILTIERFCQRADVRRLFQCPSQDPAAIQPAGTLIDAGYGADMMVYMSYVYNAAFLGGTVHPYGRAPRGSDLAGAAPGDGVSVRRRHPRGGGLRRRRHRQPRRDYVRPDDRRPTRLPSPPRDFQRRFYRRPCRQLPLPQLQFPLGQTGVGRRPTRT